MIPWLGVLTLVGILLSTFIGFGAVQELIVRGIQGGEVQPLLVGIAGTVVSLLLGLSTLALWRRRVGARRLAIVGALAAIVFHGYAALPPHRNVGLLVLVVALAYALTLLAIAFRQPEGPPTGRANPALTAR